EEWTGETGFIHQVLEKNMTEGESSEAYLCGPPIMIDAVTAVLNKGNVSDNRILYDKFQI
ncbi:MAG: oxidoreductase, partial [Spirochaetales bacterium]|nr:oxidoreductase [Spirochaetales bacterium]